MIAFFLLAILLLAVAGALRYQEQQSCQRDILDFPTPLFVLGLMIRMSLAAVMAASSVFALVTLLGGR